MRSVRQRLPAHVVAATLAFVMPTFADAQAKPYSHATQHRGACSGHGGVAEWYK